MPAMPRITKEKAAGVAAIVLGAAAVATMGVLRPDLFAVTALGFVTLMTSGLLLQCWFQKAKAGA